MPRDGRTWLGLLAAVAAAMFVFFQWTAPAPPSDPEPSGGLPTIQQADLPAEAQDTLELIDAGGPFAHEQDGAVFHNFEGELPDHDDGYYHEYTVETPGSEDRGARRIVTGDGGEYYWTDDHYQSFDRIER